MTDATSNDGGDSPGGTRSPSLTKAQERYDHLVRRLNDRNADGEEPAEAEAELAQAEAEPRQAHEEEPQAEAEPATARAARDQVEAAPPPAGTARTRAETAPPQAGPTSVHPETGPARAAKELFAPPPASDRIQGAADEHREVRLSAADISEERLLHDRTTMPAGGWRRAVHVLTNGLVSPRPSRAELEERARIATLKTPVRGCRVIATVSTKGGVGKTTTTVNLGHTFANHRGDRVVALDGNPDAGSLGYRIRLETSATADDLLNQLDEVIRYADMRAFTSQAPSRLEVVAAPDDPRVSTALGERDYRRLLSLLEHHYQLILVDCGTGILDDATRGIVDQADQLVVVTAPSVDAARASSYLLDWLETHGHEDLVAEAVAVINGCRPGRGLVDLDEVESHFARRCRAVVRVPWDRHLAAGASTGLDPLARATRTAYQELAAEVAQGFAAGRQDREGS